MHIIKQCSIHDSKFKSAFTTTSNLQSDCSTYKISDVLVIFSHCAGDIQSFGRHGVVPMLWLSCFSCLHVGFNIMMSNVVHVVKNKRSALLYVKCCACCDNYNVFIVVRQFKIFQIEIRCVANRMWTIFLTIRNRAKQKIYFSIQMKIFIQQNCQQFKSKSKSNLTNSGRFIFWN